MSRNLNSPLESWRVVPVFSFIKGKADGNIIGEIIEKVPLPFPKANPNQKYFAQYIHDDSLANLSINAGDLLFFQQKDFLDYASVGIFKISDEIIIRRIFWKNDWIILQGIGKEEPIIIKENDKKFSLIGQLVGSIKEIK